MIAGLFARSAAASAAGARAAASSSGASAATVANAKRLEAAAAATGRFNQQVQFTESRVNAATGAVAGLAGALGGKLATGLTTAMSAITAMAEPIEGLVRLANPARVNMFVIAAEDAQAVIGRQLVPVLDALTESARKVGDYYAGLEPIIGPVLTKVGELVERFFTRLVEVGQKNAPVLEMMADLLIKVGDAALQGVDLLFTAIDKVFSKLPRWVARQLGYDTDSTRADFSRSSRGAAVRQVSFAGPKQLADTAIKNALMMGVNKPVRPPERTLESMDEKLGELVRQGRDRVRNTDGREVRGGMPDVAGMLRRAMTG